MSLPTQQDWNDEHDGTLPMILRMLAFVAATSGQRLNNWGFILFVCYYRLQTCFSHSRTEIERYANIENLTLAPFQAIFDLLDQAFYQPGNNKRCILVWSRTLMPESFGVTTTYPNGMIIIRIDVRQPSAWAIMLTVLQEVVHALLSKHCCMGLCGQARCMRVWTAMCGETGNKYYWQMMAYAVELMAELQMRCPVDLQRFEEAIFEMNGSGLVPSDQYLTTVLRPRQAAIVQFYINHYMRKTRLLPWTDRASSEEDDWALFMSLEYAGLLLTSW
ncbi:uncharacterized protein CLAFUR5_04168 [Fulvia fulva]|uniref:Uncharacterized protein n=1 Tax=Passalora fulva TaxID=5499 RepID=A0A9Q8LG55_PASFU|nr:uncharacterized protein CLAFUR5_04168 [Fulvia fulva]KAK4628063.1 hypothetical protein CLAFUR0_04191 [Fulvia fulva]UJO16811.1 hypothetical protein CLAFUR5_04168 [Fulvia fulva]